MIDPTNKERQARFVARVREQGLIKVCEWIPREHRAAFKRIAAEMRGDVPATGRALGEALTVVSQAPAAALRAQVTTAAGWGWAPDAIAAYTGLSVAEVERILRGEG